MRSLFNFVKNENRVGIESKLIKSLIIIVKSHPWEVLNEFILLLKVRVVLYNIKNVFYTIISVHIENQNSFFINVGFHLNFNNT
jgi:hypothetical protein